MNKIPLLFLLCVAMTLTACSKDEAEVTSKPVVQPAEQAAPAVPAAPVAVEKVKQVAKQVTEKVEQVKATLNSGQAIYTKVCMSCHKTGILGAPKVGDKAAWAALIAGGEKKLVENAIKGTGRMPAKGGVSSLSDEEVAAAVDYMIEQSR